ncbi:MAG: hypothetical protein JST39_22545, partial [Bacteroidetes bacterium]|nr:hypothetical protein [Bacteroidota bacterium]
QYARRRIAVLENNPVRPDKPVTLHATLANDTALSFSSSYYRELYHNIDHAIHHMALIRAGISAFPHISLPAGFGVAWSTLKFRSALIPEHLIG